VPRLARHERRGLARARSVVRVLSCDVLSCDVLCDTRPADLVFDPTTAC